MADHKVPLSKETMSFFVRGVAKLATKAINDETIADSLAAGVDANEYTKRKPIILMERLREVEGDNLNVFPRAGTTEDKKPSNALYVDKFKVKDGERTVTSSFYIILAEDYPYGSDAKMHCDVIAHVDSMKGAEKSVPNPYDRATQGAKHALYEVYKNMLPKDRKAEDSMFNQRITSMAKALRDAVELHNKLSSVERLKKVRCEIRRKVTSDGVSFSTYPVFVCDANKPDDYQNYTVGAFLRLQPERLGPDATFDDLKATAERETPNDEDIDHSGNVKSLTTLVKTTPSFADYFNSDEGWAQVRKFLNSKDQRDSDDFAYRLYLLKCRLDTIGNLEERGERIEKELAA